MCVAAAVAACATRTFVYGLFITPLPVSERQGRSWPTHSAVLANQVVRSGGAVGANYNSACHAKSRPDFASKIAVVAEEAAEAAYWFEIFVAIGVMTEAAARPLIVESRELAAIAIASARTARRRKVEGSGEM